MFREQKKIDTSESDSFRKPRAYMDVFSLQTCSYYMMRLCTNVNSYLYKLYFLLYTTSKPACSVDIMKIKRITNFRIYVILVRAREKVETICGEDENGEKKNRNGKFCRVAYNLFVVRYIAQQ